MKEVSSVLDMLAEVYKVFGLTYKLVLSTRPEGYLGKVEQWDRAEAALTEALNKTGLEWEVRGSARTQLTLCAAAPVLQQVSEHKASGTRTGLEGEVPKHAHIAPCQSTVQVLGASFRKITPEHW